MAALGYQTTALAVVCTAPEHRITIPDRSMSEPASDHRQPCLPLMEALEDEQEVNLPEMEPAW